MKDILAQQIKAAYTSDKKGHWFVTLQRAVEGLTYEQAVWKPSDSVNSIAQIVAHLLFWNMQGLNTFKGLNIPAMERENADTFHIPGRDDWEESVLALEEVMAEWIAVLADADEERLKSLVSPQSSTSWHQVIADTNLHSVYHIGQIVLLRKMQGSWNSAQGVS